jgi:hypothetical protein
VHEKSRRLGVSAPRGEPEQQFDARHKGLLPLRRVDVPEALDED